MTIQEAKSQTIFYVENGIVKTTSYYDYLCEFGQGDNSTGVEESEVTTYTVDGCDFDIEKDAIEYCEENEISENEIEESTRTHYAHVERCHSNYGRKLRSSTNFYEDKDAAEASFIKGLEWFVSEKNWDAPQYFYSKEEAEEQRVERGAESMGVDIEVFISIEKKQKAIDLRIQEKAVEANNRFLAKQQSDLEIYSNIIKKIEGESYKQTEARLSAALPEKIAGQTFHKLVKQIRK